MTFAEMVAEVAARVNDASNNKTSSDRKKQYVNQAVRKLFRRLYEVSDQYIKSTTVATSSGTQEYDLPADFYAMRRVYQTNEPEILYDNFRRKGVADNTGEPMRYYIQGNYSSIGAGPTITYKQIGFTPMPDAVYTFNIDYFPIVADMAVDGDICGIPIDFHDLVVIMACMEIWTDLGIKDHYTLFEKQFKDLIYDFEMRYANQQRFDTPKFSNVFPGMDM